MPSALVSSNRDLAFPEKKPASPVLLPLALYAFLFACALAVTLKAARIRTLPAWRRFLPLALLLAAAVMSLLRGVGIPGPAALLAFPLNLTAVALAGREIHANHAHKPLP
ncbi:hypothetical protein MRQ86_00320 [Streptomyces sp. MMS21 TC-5]|uniref:hypothetical protein n=1 Tax=Streptomyces sp. MMS21 TC-5 TaxID=2925833 RepID=UPI001F61E1B1|nr:hypothetical protein [Streptomyces sp. MMS21 TC-5]MCI4078823.1 hypothetical protein [Streptomyces sp. MMS21 TC-5]